jgi:hypothetical protein
LALAIAGFGGFKGQNFWLFCYIGIMTNIIHGYTVILVARGPHNKTNNKSKFHYSTLKKACH